ncbi:MGDG synthase family glycosyltransferase [Sporomusa sphaeroides]|uniref:MGDG synthase family glycosyltransferase n=1 Tax=Sporomusa sphaeroides TaxID=47679 RepID=UPI002BD26CB9|nr:glycosyltransferase [Sporomusa sphaeroides]HML35177.1 glycosyltransferase [Sporomusa sphaeroides]
MKKNILIVSASFGAGHDQAAKAIQETLTAQAWVQKAAVVDFFGAKSSRFSSLVKKTYLQMLQHYPDFYDFLYHFVQLPHSALMAQNVSARYLKRHLRMLLAIHQPDLLVFTHPFPCGAAAYLRRTGGLNVPIVAQLTDFSVHRLWVYDEVDEYCLATETMQQELLTHGIPPSRLTVTGIPIAAKFGNKLNPAIIKAELGLNPSFPVLLIMGGGLGLGAIPEIVRELAKLSLPVNLVIPAGHNQRLAEEIAALQVRHPTIVLPYTDRIPELMAAADLLITKPGGLTCAEAMAMELPMVFFRPLPGQEEDNALYLVGQGAARWVHNRQPLADVIHSLLTVPAYLADLRHQLRLLKRPGAAAAVCSVIKRQLFDESLGYLGEESCKT